MSVRSIIARMGRTATLERPAISRDDSGGATRAWAAVAGASGEPVDIQPAGSGTELHYQQLDITVTNSLYFARNLQALAGDRLRSTSPEGDTEYYLVHGWHDASAGRRKAWVADCERMLGV